MAETKRKIRLHFLAHLRLSLVLGSAKRLNHGLIQKVKSSIVSLDTRVFSTNSDICRVMCVQAYQMRPSIIFFDEIDGLAPVRSSRQDQIHSSIVSTLLALMDGLDNRGEIVVIGATNRIDAIDPALRRPGRFDREFLFPLPSYDVCRIFCSIYLQNSITALMSHDINFF